MIGKIIELDGRKFEVIGVFEKKVSAFGGPYETMALVPSGAYTQIYGMIDQEGFPRSVNVTVHSRTPELLQDAIEQTRQVLRNVRHLKHDAPDNFYYFTSLSQIEQFNKTTLGVKIGAFLMGGVALLVAGIGIMNIMLVSVTERTKEIGIRKALGAKRRDIMSQFLVEAATLSTVGAIIGIVLGILLAQFIAAVSPLPATVAPWSIVAGVIVGAGVGIISGIYPASRASRLDPIAALRAE